MNKKQWIKLITKTIKNNRKISVRSALLKSKKKLNKQKNLNKV